MEQEVIMNRVRAERNMQGWTQAELAQKINVDPSTVTRWENGGSIPEQKLIEMRNVFRCDIDWLLGLTEERRVAK